MTTLLPKMRAKYGEGIGVELFFSFPEIKDNQRTYLDDDVQSGVILSADGTNFTMDQYIVIGQPGNVKTEIAKILSATDTTITLASNLQFPHNRGDVIRFIPYNQIAPLYSTDSGLNWNTITAVDIREDSTETYMQRSTDLSTYEYKFRFYNSTTGLYSSYSDKVSALGYPDNSIWAVKNRALGELGEERSELINEQFLNDSIMEARRAADYNPAVMRWSFRTKFNAVLGQLKAGEWKVACPADLRDPNTYKNLLSLRIGDQNRPCVYQDRVRFNQNYLNVVHANVATQQTTGGVTLVLSSTHDLPTAGGLRVANNSVGDGFIDINYTGNNKNTNTLSGVTGIDRTILVGTDVWYKAVFGLPISYTVDAGYIYFDVPLKVDYDGMDAKGDYYATITAIDSDADLFDEPFYDLFVSWLKWKIKYKKANGKVDRDGDCDYKDWMTGLANLIGQETPGQRIRFVPDINGFLGTYG